MLVGSNCSASVQVGAGMILNIPTTKMAMTYRDLLKYLQSIPDERLDDNVTVYVSGEDEYYELASDYPVVFTTDEEDRLDVGHHYLVI